MALHATLHRLHFAKALPGLAWPLALLNLAAVWYGYTDYYGNQLAATPVHLRPFVADSPNAVFLFALVLLLYQFGIRHAALDVLAWVENVKVGAWTVFVLLYRYEEFFRDDFALRWTLLVLHVGMVFQVWALHRDLRVDRPSWAWFLLVAAWVFVGDALDYGPLRLHPYLRGEADAVIVGVTIALSVLALAWAAAWYRPRSAARARKR